MVFRPFSSGCVFVILLQPQQSGHQARFHTLEDVNNSYLSCCNFSVLCRSSLVCADDILLTGALASLDRLERPETSEYVCIDCSQHLATVPGEPDTVRKLLVTRRVTPAGVLLTRRHKHTPTPRHQNQHPTSYFYPLFKQPTKMDPNYVEQKKEEVAKEVGGWALVTSHPPTPPRPPCCTHRLALTAVCASARRCLAASHLTT